MVMKRFIARAAASKAGPRLAEVAGRTRCSEVGRRVFFSVLPLFIVVSFSDVRACPVGFLGLLQSFEHGLQGCIEDDGRMPERIQSGALGLHSGVLKKIAAVKFHSEVRILEQASGEHEDDSFIRLYKSLLQ